MRRDLFLTCLLAGGLIMTAAGADTTIEFAVKQSPTAAPQTQSVYIKDGMLMVKAAGGDPTADLLFDEKTGVMTIINHQERTFMKLDEKRIGEMTQQAESMMTAVQQQMAQQLANLPPEQAAQMRAMMGNMGMGAMGTPPPPPQPSKLVKQGPGKINGIDCQKMDVLKGQRKVAEICVASPDSVGIPDQDHAVIQAMQAFGERVAEKTSGFLSRFGSEMPEFGGMRVDGVPVSMVDLSSESQTSMTVTRIDSGTGDVVPGVPPGYAEKQLPSLPQ